MTEVLGLAMEAEDLAIVREILGRLAPGVGVWAFGSRVEGRARKFSDLDLALVADEPLDWRFVAEVKEAFSFSNLPCRVDVVDFGSAPAWLQDTIGRRHIILQDP